MEPLLTPSETESSTAPSATDESIVQVLAKLDKTALGIAVGILFGLVVFTATLFLIAKGGAVVGPNLALLGQYFIGYTVTFKGSVNGLVYGFISGFVVGWLIAFLRNLCVSIYLHAVKLRASMSSVSDFIDAP